MVEKFAGWFKSSYSGDGSTGGCVEVAFAADGAVGVRDSKAKGGGPVLEFTTGEWSGFVSDVRAGSFDYPM